MKNFNIQFEPIKRFVTFSPFAVKLPIFCFFLFTFSFSLFNVVYSKTSNSEKGTANYSYNLTAAGGVNNNLYSTYANKTADHYNLVDFTYNADITRSEIDSLNFEYSLQRKDYKSAKDESSTSNNFNLSVNRQFTPETKGTINLYYSIMNIANQALTDSKNHNFKATAKVETKISSASTGKFNFTKLRKTYPYYITSDNEGSEYNIGIDKNFSNNSTIEFTYGFKVLNYANSFTKDSLGATVDTRKDKTNKYTASFTKILTIKPISFFQVSAEKTALHSNSTYQYEATYGLEGFDADTKTLYQSFAYPNSIFSYNYANSNTRAFSIYGMKEFSSGSKLLVYYDIENTYYPNKYVEVSLENDGSNLDDYIKKDDNDLTNYINSYTYCPSDCKKVSYQGPHYPYYSVSGNFTYLYVKYSHKLSTDYYLDVYGTNIKSTFNDVNFTYRQKNYYLGLTAKY